MQTDPYHIFIQPFFPVQTDTDLKVLLTFSVFQCFLLKCAEARMTQCCSTEKGVHYFWFQLKKRKYKYNFRCQICPKKSTSEISIFSFAIKKESIRWGTPFWRAVSAAVLCIPCGLCHWCVIVLRGYVSNLGVVPTWLLRDTREIRPNNPQKRKSSVWAPIFLLLISTVQTDQNFSEGDPDFFFFWQNQCPSPGCGFRALRAPRPKTPSSGRSSSSLWNQERSTLSPWWLGLTGTTDSSAPRSSSTSRKSSSKWSESDSRISNGLDFSGNLISCKKYIDF